MRLRALVLVCLLAPAPAAGAAELMVVGRDGESLLAPRAASEGAARVRVDGDRCRVAGRTALATLVRTPLALALEDFGACGRPAEASGLYVAGIEGQRERGADGWVYKLGNKVPSLGAGDRSGRFGRSARVLWFWCESGPDGCQRTLSVRAKRKDDRIRARVRAHDNNGASVPAAGARVRLGSRSAVTNAKGVARLPFAAGRLVATKPGVVRSFPVRAP